MTQRLTFRDKAGDVAWQRQLRDNYADEGTPPVSSLKLKHARVRPVSYTFAKQIILKYEWLGTMANTTHHYGIFFDMYCAGVVCIAVPFTGAGANVHKEWNLSRYQVAYLARGANVHWSPTGANSKLVAWACKFIAKTTHAKLIIAYSDTDAGEIGTIYQACNWVCVGRGSRTKQWISPSGKIHDQKLPSNLRKQQGNIAPRQTYVQMLRDAGWTEQQTNPKYRYVYVLDKTDTDLLDIVASKQVDYPKRDR